MTIKQNVSLVSLLVGMFASEFSAFALESDKSNLIDEGDVVSISDMVFTAQSNEVSSGGAINNNGQIESIEKTSFVDNVVLLDKNSYGGAITNNASIDKVDNSSFVRNKAVNGAAIYNSGTGKIDDINAYFESNQAKASDEFGASRQVFAQGGVFYNLGNIEKISGYFLGNSAVSDLYYAYGGAIFNGKEGNIGSISAEFVQNYAFSNSNDAFGGALISGVKTTVGKVEKSLFKENYVYSKMGTAQGGAIRVNGDFGTIINSSFLSNSAKTDTGTAYGGAIYSLVDLAILADSGESVFAGNYVEDVEGRRNEAIYAKGGKLNLTAVNGGVIDFEDDINGVDYDITLSGDESGEIVFNGKVSGASAFNAESGAVYHLGKNAELNVAEYKSDNAMLKLDIAADADKKIVDSGVINVSGDVVGNTKVIVNAENPITYENAKTMFVNAENFEGGAAEQFEVSRVIGSPYMWQSVVNAGGEESGSHWYLSLTDEENPYFTYAPEVAAYVGLQSVAVEQNRSVADSVAKGLAYKKSLNCYEESCGVAEIMPHKQAWIDVSYENAEIDAPADMDAKISGTTLGLDLYRDTNQRAGAFGAYRYGKYDLSGKGKYYAKIKSDITNKSYLGGAYYQYDNDDVRFTGILFAGKQDMDIRTADGIAKASTDAMQYGASAEAAKRYAISQHLELEPSLGLYYSLIDVDKLEDNVGKQADFDILHYLEAELGLKLEYTFCWDGCTNKVYAKPSVIRTFTSGGKTRISGMDEVKSYEDKTLGRMELGGEFGLSNRWNGWAAAGYTFGDDYKAYDVNIGVGYRF